MPAYTSEVVIYRRHFVEHTQKNCSELFDFNRPFSKMAAENSNKLKLAKTKNVYQH